MNERQIITLGRAELMEAVGDWMAKRVGAAVHIHGITTTLGLDLDPGKMAIQVEFSPKLPDDEPAPVIERPSPTEALP